MPKIIISDTSCFIILSNIGELELLKKIYGKIYTTHQIASEFGEQLPNWVEILEIKDIDKQQILEIQIDKGEASAICLALETPNSVLILDDYKARKLAEILNLPFTGTIGVFVRAKLDGHINSIKPLLNKLKQTDFRISIDIEIQALKAANE